MKSIYLIIFIQVKCNIYLLNSKFITINISISKLIILQGYVFNITKIHQNYSKKNIF